LVVAKVGGIHANNTQAQRLVFARFASIRDCPQSVKGEYLLTGSLDSMTPSYAHQFVWL